MLNELYELSKALSELGLLHTTTHPNINAVVRETSLLIEIDKTGVAKGSRLLSNDETANLWRHSRGNHHSFPAIRVQEPLLAPTESTKLEEVDWRRLKLMEKLECLSELDFRKANPECSKIYISEWSLGELTFNLQDYPKLSALEQLVKTFPREENWLSFLESLLSFLKGKLTTATNEAEVDMIKKLLIGNWDRNRQKYVAGCMTYYDVYETDEHPNTVASSTTRLVLAKLLTEREEISFAKGDHVCSPLSGVWQAALNDKYPNPNLPILGLTYFYSKKEETPCLMRYGKSGIQAYRIGKQESNAMNNALAFLTGAERKGKTWSAVQDCNRDTPNLMLAYLADDPCNDALLAQVMADPAAYASKEEHLEELESYFEALCQQVLGKTEELLQKNPESKVNLIMLESLDPGRKQVLYQRFLPIKQVQRNLLTWQEASENYPPLPRHLQGKNGVKLESPGPNEIIRLSKVYYSSSGKIQFSKQSFTSLYEVYELYMPQTELTEEDNAFVLSFLEKTLTATGQLLEDVGHFMKVNFTSLTETEKNTLLKIVQSTISLISVLLWHIGIRKENYMNNSPFNLGQLLQLADELHKQYCKLVRNKSEGAGYPPRFIGGEMLPIALQDPIEGINRLDERMKIYIDWAKTTVSEGTGLAKFFLKQIGEVSYKIASEPFPKEYGPAERAQLFLGYLATVPKEGKVAQDEKEEA